MTETSHYGTPFGNIRLRYWPAAGASGEAGSRGGNNAEDKAEAWPTVVLVHGMFGDVDVWSATALNLTRAGLSVLAADLPGHGESTAEVDSAEQAAQAIGAALDAWKAAPTQAEVTQDGQRLLLVGHSFGALVASALAASLEKMGLAGRAGGCSRPAGWARRSTATSCCRSSRRRMMRHWPARWKRSR